MRYNMITHKDELSGNYRSSNIDLQGLINKIGELEDLTNCPIDTIIALFKGLKDGIWCLDDDNLVVKDSIDNVDFGVYEYDFGFENSSGYYYISDYGNTWALTEEELVVE